MKSVRTATILFCDVRNSSQIANVLSIHEYDHFISQFQQVTRSTLEEKCKGLSDSFEFSVRGDEAFFMVNAEREDEETVVSHLRLALDIAFSFKRGWLLSRFNRRRISEGKAIEDIGIGINVGDVVLATHPGRPAEPTAEGWAINLAKKIEGSTREAHYSKIMVSENAYQRIRHEDMGLFFDQPRMYHFEHIDRTMPIYEVKAFAPKEWRPKVKLSDRDLTLMRRAAANNPFDLWLTLSTASYFYQREQYETALRIYQDAIHTEPQFAHAHLDAGLCYYEMQRFDRALECFETAARIEPGYVNAFYMQAMCYGQTGRNDDELTFYQRALEIDPFHSDSLLNSAEVLLLCGRNGECVKVTERVLGAELPEEDKIIARLITVISSAVSNGEWRSKLRDLKQRVAQLRRNAVVYGFKDLEKFVTERLPSSSSNSILRAIEQLKRRGAERSNA